MKHRMATPEKTEGEGRDQWANGAGGPSERLESHCTSREWCRFHHQPRKKNSRGKIDSSHLCHLCWLCNFELQATDRWHCVCVCVWISLCFSTFVPAYFTDLYSYSWLTQLIWAFILQDSGSIHCLLYCLFHFLRLGPPCHPSSSLQSALSPAHVLPVHWHNRMDLPDFLDQIWASAV